MITQEQAEQVRKQLLSQLSNFPEDKREQIKEKITSMSLEEMDEFVKQNQLLEKEGEGEQKCIFCSITSGKMKSYKIDEDKDHLSVLEINPLSKGHVLILPKEHLEKIYEKTQKYAEKLAEKIKKRLNISELKIKENNIFGHAIIEIVPQPESNRKNADQKELEEIQKILLKEEKEEIPEKKAEVKEIKEVKEKPYKRKLRIP